MHGARQALIDQGIFPVKEIAAIVGCHPRTVRKRLQRSRERGDLFTVRINGETHVPAVLLDGALDARPELQPVITALAGTGMTNWTI